MMFMKIWKTIIQERKGVLMVFDDMIADIEFEKQINSYSH